jgi:xanthine dehydrogenase molybdenum-binding subunit
MTYDLLGKNFTPPDVRAKVTGKAKYAEDFRADGMLFCRLLTSPMPHARVRNIDASEALKMEGVVAVLTPDEVPNAEAPWRPILATEPMFVGEPIAAVAAVDETTAHDALERIKVDYEPLPYTVDPLESLYPGGPSARSDGNVTNRAGVPLQTLHWTARDFASAEEGQLPMTGEAPVDWSYGDLEAGFAAAKVVYDETFVTTSNAHHSMEPRSAMAYWQNGKCFLHASSQSHTNSIAGIAKLLEIEPEDVVLIAEFCGGGFGSKGSAYPSMAIPAFMAKKTGRPVLLRISRAEEYFLGSSRPGFQGRIKIGFREDGRIAAVDVYIVQHNGGHEGFPDFGGAGEAISIVHTPLAMRVRAVPVSTNTPYTGAQRGPGQNQMAMVMEPLLDRAARDLGLDRLAVREKNAPDADTLVSSQRAPVTSAYMREALAKAAADFNYAERITRSGQRNGSKVTGIGIGQAYHSAGWSGFDGLVRLTPAGKLHIHTGVGNLGTYSYAATSRVAAEVLKCDWANCVIERGDSRKHLPLNNGQFGSNSTFTMTRTNYAAAMDALAKIKEIAAMDLGGEPDDFDVAGERVFKKDNPESGLSYAEVAQRAIELGGKYSGAEAPDDIRFPTTAAVQGVAGTGLVGVAKDKIDKPGVVPGLAVGLMEIELDLETGKYQIIDYTGVVDCGSVVHPVGLATQIRGGAVQGIGMAGTERVIYDPQNGLPANVGFYQSKPPSYLDVPSEMVVGGVDLPDPHNPVGAKGMGEPPMGASASALLSAISDALGGHIFNRTPVVPDMIVNHVAGREQSHKPLQTFTA